PFTVNAEYTFDGERANAIKFSSSLVDFSDQPEVITADAPLTIDQAVDRTLDAIRARRARGETSFRGTSLTHLECLCINLKNPHSDHRVVRAYIDGLNQYAAGSIGLDDLLVDFGQAFSLLKQSYATEDHLLGVLYSASAQADSVLQYLIRHEAKDDVAFPPRLEQLGQWIAQRMNNPSDIYSCFNYGP